MSRNAKFLRPHEVRYTFKGENTRDLPLIIAASCRSSPRPITPSIDFTKSTLDPPLGSGPYKIGDFKQGQYVSLSAPRRLLGRRSAGEQGPLQFR